MPARRRTRRTSRGKAPRNNKEGDRNGRTRPQRQPSASIFPRLKNRRTPHQSARACPRTTSMRTPAASRASWLRRGRRRRCPLHEHDRGASARAGAFTDPETMHYLAFLVRWGTPAPSPPAPSNVRLVGAGTARMVKEFARVRPRGRRSVPIRRRAAGSRANGRPTGSETSRFRRLRLARAQAPRERSRRSPGRPLPCRGSRVDVAGAGYLNVLRSGALPRQLPGSCREEDRSGQDHRRAHQHQSQQGRSHRPPAKRGPRRQLRPDAALLRREGRGPELHRRHRSSGGGRGRGVPASREEDPGRGRSSRRVGAVRLLLLDYARVSSSIKGSRAPDSGEHAQRSRK
jgi:hypothetical protein